jgi:hypothetical protein
VIISTAQLTEIHSSRFSSSGTVNPTTRVERYWAVQYQKC